MAISGMTMLQEMPVMSAYLLKFMPKCYRKVTEQQAKKDWTDCICQMVVDIRAEFSYCNSKGVQQPYCCTYQPAEQVRRDAGDSGP